MQGFNRYFPPDFEPEVHDTLNNYHGKHALGDRARKIDRGILITRFELPFNIWCGSCEAHIGMGVRYNAEKKKVGMYHSTPIYSFRCKCHLCGNWFEIRTDPQNTRYVVESGARQKNEEWDEVENGGIVLNRKEDGQPVDAFADVEKKTKDKIAALASKDRLEELMEFSETRNSDPFALSQKVRKTFRKEKAELINKSYSDDSMRTKYSLPSKLRLIEGREEERRKDEEQAKEAKRLIARHKLTSESKRCRLNAELGLTQTRNLSALPPKAAQLATLKEQLVSSRTRKTPNSLVVVGSLVSRQPIKPAKPIVPSNSKIQLQHQPVASTSQKPLASLTSYSSD